MNQRLTSSLKKVPGLRAVVHWNRLRIRTRKTRALLQSLRPLSTDKKLIRFGPDGDGGYLIPDDMAGIRTCFSPGVSFVSGFEKDCADLGMHVFLADASVDGPAEAHALFSFTKKFIGGTARDGFITLDEWVSRSVADANSDLILQIDIEGYEYEVFLSTSDALMHRFRIIVAEFHLLDELVSVWSDRYKEIIRTFQKILRSHACVHIHPNNCCGSVKTNGMEIPKVMEFTFLRKDRFGHSEYETSFPHELDADNTGKPPLVLPECWYRTKGGVARLS